MKKILSLLIFTFYFTVNIFSQVEFGAKAGLNYSNVRFTLSTELSVTNDLDDTDPFLGIHAGFFASTDLNSHFSLEANLLYTQVGYNFTDLSFNTEIETILHSISLPILIGYKILPKTTINIGPDLSLLMASKKKIDGFSQDASEIFSKKISASGSVGISHAFTDRLGADFRYIHGITHLNKDDETLVFDNQGTAIGTAEFKIRSRVFQLSMRYKF